MRICLYWAMSFLIFFPERFLIACSEISLPLCRLYKLANTKVLNDSLHVTRTTEFIADPSEFAFKAGDTLEDFHILTDFKDVGDLGHEDYFNHF